MYSTRIIAEIIQNTTNKLFLYPGGTIAPLLHECKNIKVNLIVTKHEQGAGYMAIAEALLTNKPSFVAVTSGPGATNIVTSVAEAYYDSIPLIIITGQVGTADLSRSNDLRQRGFQEVPIIDLVKQITKKTYQPKNVFELSFAIREAYKISNSGRKGPVLIDIPMDIQLKEINENELKELSNLNKLEKVDNHNFGHYNIDESIKLIKQSKKPVFLIGGGCQEDWFEIRKLLSNCAIPILTTLRGIGVIETSKSCGWIGHTGMPWANKILYNSDCVITLGSRLDIRQTGSEIKIFDNKKIIHIDIDDIELNECRIKNTLKIKDKSVHYLKKFLKNDLEIDISQWTNEIRNIKSISYKMDNIGKEEGVAPLELLQYINTLIKDKKSYITTGVGSHQHWTARYFDFDNNINKLFTSSGHGTMGFSLPVALGLKYINNDNIVLCIDGDGSFQLNIQELALIEEYNLKIKILIMNNSRLGIVSQFQQIVFNDDPTTGNQKSPNFAKIANAYNIESFTIDSLDKETIEKWINSDKASLLNVKIKPDSALSPMLLGGQKLNEMWYYE